ncbi:MAG TPA: 23S rRNA (pseudouridine(1915)-N(3))-methyltransferase RlmH [Rickettsiales bacterium]|nr:23S rRNA (pseudouridine(1915)-N(3))-methyltransferase RlmH [Rickettsiales bacterium]
MHILLATIGKFKSGPEAALYEHYTKRLLWKTTLKEFDIKKPLPPEQKKLQEAELLLGACKEADHIIALDETGREMGSQEFASHLRRREDAGDRKIAFIIGGADGLHESVRKRANLLLSFGRVTWPHLLVRGLIAEQLYRAYTILNNHPYHRE